MTELTAPTTAWHRQQAVSIYNRVWELIDLPVRSSEEDEEMLRGAFASRHHWEQVGGDQERAVGDWQIARVASLLNLADVALRCAQAALERAERQGWSGWRLASMREGMARALAVAGDRPGRDRYVALAREALADEDDGEDRALIEAQLASIP